MTWTMGMKQIELPGTGDFKGMAADAQRGILYITANWGAQLIALDLRTDKELWRLKLEEKSFPDSIALTRDGRFLYLPMRNLHVWRVLDTTTREMVATLPIDKADVMPGSKVYREGEPWPHNTVLSADGRFMFLESLGVNYIHVADTATHRIVRKIGPFSNGVRPFVLSPDDRYVFANVDGLLGFEVADVATGKIIHRLENHTPAERAAVVPITPEQAWHRTPSHGIGLRPDGKEVWVSNDVFGLVHVWDVTVMPPTPVADVPLYRKASDRDDLPHSSWIGFSLDGRYCYPCGTDAVIDTQTKQIVARMASGEKIIEIHFAGDKPVRAGRR